MEKLSENFSKEFENWTKRQEMLVVLKKIWIRHVSDAGQMALNLNF